MSFDLATDEGQGWFVGYGHPFQNVGRLGFHTPTALRIDRWDRNGLLGFDQVNVGESSLGQVSLNSHEMVSHDYLGTRRKRTLVRLEVRLRLRLRS